MDEHIEIQINNDTRLDIQCISLPIESLLDRESEILFLGEGNFTFSFSFACLRCSWYNLFATAYNSTLPSFEEAQVETIRNILSNLNWNKDEPALEYIHTVSNFRYPDYPWQHSIDATNLPNELSLPIIWFQCPWVQKWKRTPDLLKNFFDHVGSKQQKGDIIILGIISIRPYCESYALDILTKGTEYYNFIGGDDKFITELLNRGYRHQGIRDIHRVIYHSHVSLLFIHK